MTSPPTPESSKSTRHVGRFNVFGFISEAPTNLAKKVTAWCVCIMTVVGVISWANSARISWQKSAEAARDAVAVAAVTEDHRKQEVILVAEHAKEVEKTATQALTVGNANTELLKTHGDKIDSLARKLDRQNATINAIHADVAAVVEKVGLRPHTMTPITDGAVAKEDFNIPFPRF